MIFRNFSFLEISFFRNFIFLEKQKHKEIERKNFNFQHISKFLIFDHFIEIKFLAIMKKKNDKLKLMQCQGDY